MVVQSLLHPGAVSFWLESFATDTGLHPSVRGHLDEGRHGLHTTMHRFDATSPFPCPP
jgi:hypothetical protein